MSRDAAQIREGVRTELRRVSKLLAKRLRRLRTAKGWSFEDLSKRTGLPAGSLRKQERQDLLHNMTMASLLAVREAYGLRVASLFSPEETFVAHALEAGIDLRESGRKSEE